MTEIIIPLSVVLLMYWLLREMQTWLHRHIFKVGWLVTKNFETTTILYYTVFLPGVFLNQLTIWLAAGAFNVRADRQISYPEKQEIGELKLDFVKLGKKAPQVILNIIQLIPFIVGLIVIWLIAVHAFDIFTVLDLLADPEQGLGLSLQYMFTRPDFWLWAYFVFTIANTMLPDLAVFKGLHLFMIIGVIIFVLMVFDGNTGDVSGVLVPPILSISNGLSLLFGVIIAVDAVATIALAIIENSIEIVTGDSATFKNGKMIAMKRAEVIAQRKAEREKEQRKREREKSKAIVPLAAGPPSVYALELPLPDAPGSLPRRLILESESAPELEPPRHRDPDVIVTQDGAGDDDQQDVTQTMPAKPAKPFLSDRMRTMPSMSPSTNETDDSDNDEALAEEKPKDSVMTSTTPEPFLPVSRRSPFADSVDEDDLDSDSPSMDESQQKQETPEITRINPFTTPGIDDKSDKVESESPLASSSRKPLFERKERYASAMQKPDDSDISNKTGETQPKQDKSASPMLDEPRAKPTGLLRNRSERTNPFSTGVTKPVPKPATNPDKTLPKTDTSDSLDDLRSDVDDDLEYEDIYDDYADEVSEDEIDERF